MERLSTWKSGMQCKRGPPPIKTFTFPFFKASILKAPFNAFWNYFQKNHISCFEARATNNCIRARFTLVKDFAHKETSLISLSIERIFIIVIHEYGYIYIDRVQRDILGWLEYSHTLNTRMADGVSRRIFGAPSFFLNAESQLIAPKSLVTRLVRVSGPSNPASPSMPSNHLPKAPVLFEKVVFMVILKASHSASFCLISTEFSLNLFITPCAFPKKKCLPLSPPECRPLALQYGHMASL